MVVGGVQNCAREVGKEGIVGWIHSRTTCSAQKVCCVVEVMMSKLFSFSPPCCCVVLSLQQRDTLVLRSGRLALLSADVPSRAHRQTRRYVLQDGPQPLRDNEILRAKVYLHARRLFLPHHHQRLQLVCVVAVVVAVVIIVVIGVVVAVAVAAVVVVTAGAVVAVVVVLVDSGSAL